MSGREARSRSGLPTAAYFRAFFLPLRSLEEAEGDFGLFTAEGLGLAAGTASELDPPPASSDFEPEAAEVWG